MRTYFAVLILSAVATFIMTPFVRRLAFLVGAVDQPSARKIHLTPMPRLGGLAVFGGFCFPWLSFYLVNNSIALTFHNYEKLFACLSLAALAMLALGMYDDIWGANAVKKFTVQVAIAVGLYLADFQITKLSNPFGHSFELGWLSLPVSVLWIVGITNAMNLLDGIDGLATGVTTCIALSLAAINIMAGNVIVALLTLCLAGACLGFLPYNFAPARIFLGDSGSLLLGLLLACIGMYSLFKGATATLMIVPLVLFGLPVFDTAQVIWGRLRRGVPLFQADTSHIHHRLLRKGWNQKQIAYYFYALTVILGGLAISFQLAQSPRGWAVLFLLSLALTGCIWMAWRLRVRALKKTVNESHSYAAIGGCSESDPVGD